jgi:hypothetical protein
LADFFAGFAVFLAGTFFLATFFLADFFAGFAVFLAATFFFAVVFFFFVAIAESPVLGNSKMNSFGKVTQNLSILPKSDKNS